MNKQQQTALNMLQIISYYANLNKFITGIIMEDGSGDKFCIYTDTTSEFMEIKQGKIIAHTIKQN